jgi:hypothetical protein
MQARAGRPDSGSRPNASVVRRYRVGAVVAVLAALALALVLARVANTGGRCAPGGCGHITRWRATSGFHPLTDAQAKALVRPAAETRPGNARANADMPTSEELARFRATRSAAGEMPEQRNPYLAYVTGHFAGTTDEIIQWVAHKWGIPEDWLRAQYALESHWRQAAMGDPRHESPAARARFPAFSCPTRRQCYESLGISQIKWRPDRTSSAGTEPLRWTSTAFNADYQAATVRLYYDDPRHVRSSWGDPEYQPGERWLSVAGWFSPYPWGNPLQREYLRKLKQVLAGRVWTRGDF